MQKKNIVTCILLTIVTCGIYGIVWFINITNDVGTASGDSNFRGGKAFLLTLVTCGIYGFVWAYTLGKNVGVIKQKLNGTSDDSSVLFLILHLLGLGIVNYCLAQSEVNNYIDRQTPPVMPVPPVQPTQTTDSTTPQNPQM